MSGIARRRRSKKDLRCCNFILSDKACDEMQAEESFFITPRASSYLPASINPSRISVCKQFTISGSTASCHHRLALPFLCLELLWLHVSWHVSAPRSRFSLFRLLLAYSSLSNAAQGIRSLGKCHYETVTASEFGRPAIVPFSLLASVEIFRSSLGSIPLGFVSVCHFPFSAVAHLRFWSPFEPTFSPHHSTFDILDKSHNGNRNS